MVFVPKSQWYLSQKVKWYLSQLFKVHNGLEESPGGGLARRGRGANDVEAEGTKFSACWILSQKSKLTQEYASICYATKAILCRRTNGSCWRLARHQADLACNVHGQAWLALIICSTECHGRQDNQHLIFGDLLVKDNRKKTGHLKNRWRDTCGDVCLKKQRKLRCRRCCPSWLLRIQQLPTAGYNPRRPSLTINCITPAESSDR